MARRIVSVRWCFVFAALLGGCATFSVTPTSPEDKRTQGFRYYLPRPFVVVKQPFAVGGGEYLVTGTVDSKNRLVRIDKRALPKEVAELLGSPADAAAIEVAFDAVLKSAGPTDQGGAQAANANGGTGTTGTTAGGTTAANAPKPEAIGGADGIKYLNASDQPKELGADVNLFNLKVNLAADAPFTELTEPAGALVPLGPDGVPLPEKFIALQTTETTRFDPTKAAGVYDVVGSRSQIKDGTQFLLGLRFKAKRTTPADTEAKPYLVFSTGKKMIVYSKPAAQEQPEAPSPEQQFSDISKVLLATSGDPATSPLIPLNDQFDVLLLPDLDQQFAINISAGIGQANLALGLENGWMLERAGVMIDNRELGKWVLTEASKFTEIARNVITQKWLPALSPSTEQEGGQQAGKATEEGAVITLRISSLIEAQPGIYPFLRPNENVVRKKPVRDALPGKDDVTVIRPDGDEAAVTYGANRPYTVVSYNVRKRVLVELVDVAPKVEHRQAPAESDEVVDKFFGALMPLVTTATQDKFIYKSDSAVRVAESLTFKIRPSSDQAVPDAEFDAAINAVNQAIEKKKEEIVKLAGAAYPGVKQVKAER